MQPWLEWHAPASNTLHTMPFGEIGTIQNDPVDPADSYASNEIFTDLSDESIDIIAQYATASDSPLLYNELRQGGGAMARGDSDSSAVGNRDASFYFVMGGLTPTPQAHKVVEAYAQRYKNELKPYVQDGVYLNFLRGKEASKRVKDAYTPSAYKRLVALKSKYDPDNRFRYSYQLVSRKSS